MNNSEKKSPESQEKMSNKNFIPGLYIVSTPIGNLEDITLRAIRILKSVDFIVAEDTRHVQKLLHHYEIHRPVFSFHSYSSQEKLQKIIAELKNGKSYALVCDSGTPGISDPGYGLIRAALDVGISVIPIPGPSALLAALVASGLEMHHFVFYGFLPLKKGRQTLLKSWHSEDRTIIFYESPHRIKRTLDELLQILGPDWNIVLARELTKIHEEFIRGSLSQITEDFKKRTPKGEFVVLLQKNES